MRNCAGFTALLTFVLALLPSIVVAAADGPVKLIDRVWFNRYLGASVAGLAAPGTSSAARSASRMGFGISVGFASSP